ncbi:hypothetical protein BC826DRAFT_1030878, partial [Russula brevipes]
NWRAAAAAIVSVPLTLPGLVNNIDPKIQVGVGTRLFDIAYILGVSTISVVLPATWVGTQSCRMYSLHWHPSCT